MNFRPLRFSVKLLWSKASLGLILAAVCCPGVALAQSQTQPPPPPATQQQAQPPQQASQPQTSSQPATETLADAARKAKAKKAEAKPVAGKVYTEEDMSGLSSHGVSVVGEGGGRRESGREEAAPSSGDSQEQYWRGRARQIHEQMDSTDAQIKQTEEDIKKYGNGGFDPATGLRQNVIYFEDRQAKLSALKKHRADLDKQLDDLQEEARKADVLPAWVR